MSVRNERVIYGAEFLDRCLRDEDGVVIYGIGMYGSAVVDYIIESGNKEKIRGIVVTNLEDAPGEYKGIPVCEAGSYFRDRENGKFLVVVAVTVKIQESIVVLLENYGIKRWYCLTREAYLDLIRNGDKRQRIPYQGVDFLVAGFAKCGTTSLQCVLRDIDSIFVPYEKETQFFWWFDKVENAEEKLIKRYFSDIREGQKIVGAVEPTFCSHADEIYQYFGPSVRIVLLMRNPTDAAFSLYKMENRAGSPIFEDMYQKYGVYQEEMFENYFDNVIKNETYQLHYDYWLKKFYERFSKEQVYVAFFEELINAPEREMSNILAFIGIEEKHAISSIPRANEGNFVMKNLDGYRVAKQIREIRYFTTHPFAEEEKSTGGGHDALRLMKLEREFGKADKLNLKASKKEQDMLKQYFYTDVRNLENILNRDLSEIWF